MAGNNIVRTRQPHVSSQSATPARDHPPEITTNEPIEPTNQTIEHGERREPLPQHGHPPGDRSRRSGSVAAARSGPPGFGAGALLAGAVARASDITDVMGGNVFHAGRFLQSGSGIRPGVCRGGRHGSIHISVYFGVWFCCFGVGGCVWVGCVVVVGCCWGAVVNGSGGEITRKRFMSHPSGCLYPDSRPLFFDAVHVEFCVRPCGFVLPPVDGGSTHVSVCEARPVQRGYANQSSSSVVGFIVAGWVVVRWPILCGL